jgi:NAD(P)-dependent dehydrogenase (short-subunit alcohol dehydrogenase family)
MDLQLAGKSALVSGSTAGIGFAIAQGLAREGAEVVINGRTQERVDTAVATIKKKFPDSLVQGFAGDLSKAEVADELFKRYPGIEILINNLSIFEPKEFTAITDDEWSRFFEVNVLSGVRLSRWYLPRMLKSDWGRIVFISSESALQIPAEMIHYGMTKTAQLAVARGLAELTVGTGVTVNSVLPGPTASEGVTDFVTSLAKQQNQSVEEFEQLFFEKIRPTSLLKRFASTEEVANMVIYVCSPLASATNGSALRVDGGVIRAIV